MISEIYSDSAHTCGHSDKIIRGQLESGQGIGRDHIFKDSAGKLIGRRGVESAPKNIHETGAFPSILEKAGAPQEVGYRDFAEVMSTLTEPQKGLSKCGCIIPICPQALNPS